MKKNFEIKYVKQFNPLGDFGGDNLTSYNLWYRGGLEKLQMDVEKILAGATHPRGSCRENPVFKARRTVRTALLLTNHEDKFKKIVKLDEATYTTSDGLTVDCEEQEYALLGGPYYYSVFFAYRGSDWGREYNGNEWTPVAASLSGRKIIARGVTTAAPEDISILTTQDSKHWTPLKLHSLISGEDLLQEKGPSRYKYVNLPDDLFQVRRFRRNGQNSYDYKKLYEYAVVSTPLLDLKQRRVEVAIIPVHSSIFFLESRTELAFSSGGIHNKIATTTDSGNSHSSYPTGKDDMARGRVMARGWTPFTPKDIELLLERSFQPKTYDLLSKNCNFFAQEAYWLMSGKVVGKLTKNELHTLKRNWALHKHVPV